MPAQERLNAQGRKHIAGLANTAKVLWAKACEHDEIPTDSKFVVFSDGNKFAEFYNICIGQLFQARREFACGGYVGLTISRGKAA